MQASRTWSSYLLPVLIAMGSISALNFLWNISELRLYKIIEHPVVVYLIGGSGVSLYLLWRLLSDGRLTSREAGIDLAGWSPWRRLVGLAVILFFAVGAYTNLKFALPPHLVDAAEFATSEVPDGKTAVPKPSWGDFCFWLTLGLAASLAELLVFVSIGFCLTKRFLQHIGCPAWVATILALIFSSVSFGVYHYTHASIWWPLIYSIYIPVMVINLLTLLVTRNFYIIILLHGVFTALGMTLMQYTSLEPHPSMDLDVLQTPAKFLPTFSAFLVPFLLLHGLEWSFQDRHKR